MMTITDHKKIINRTLVCLRRINRRLNCGIPTVQKQRMVIAVFSLKVLEHSLRNPTFDTASIKYRETCNAIQ